MAIALCLLSAMVLGVGFVLQQHAAEQAPKAYFLRLRLITDLMRRPRWLLGMGVMGIGQLLSAWAVGHMVLSLYEPLQAMSLIFALSDALTRRVMEIMDAHSFVTLFTSWPVYCLVASSVIGLWLMETAYRTGLAAPPGRRAAAPRHGTAD